MHPQGEAATHRWDLLPASKPPMLSASTVPGVPAVTVHSGLWETTCPLAIILSPRTQRNEPSTPVSLLTRATQERETPHLPHCPPPASPRWCCTVWSMQCKDRPFRMDNSQQILLCVWHHQGASTSLWEDSHAAA